jgi:hypothetical protein
MRPNNRYNQDDRISYYRDKNTFCEHLKLSNKINNITPQKIIKELDLDPIEDINYSKHLNLMVKEFRNKRREKSLEVRQTKKEDNKEWVRKWLKKKLTHIKMSELLGVNKKTIQRYVREIEFENNNKLEMSAFSYFKSCVTQYKNISQTIKEIGYLNLPNYLKGHLNHIKSLGINKSNINFFNYNTLNLQMSTFKEKYDITKLEKQLEQHKLWIDDDFDIHSDNTIARAIKLTIIDIEIGQTWNKFLEKYKLDRI